MTVAIPYQVDTSFRVVTVVDDVTTHFRVLVSGRVVSGAFDQRPLPQLRVTADWPGLHVKTMPDGLFCLAGVESHLFPVYPVSFTLTISAAYHRSLSLPLTINAPSDLPIALPDTELLYAPVSLQGRVTLDDLDRTPVAGATVTIDDPAVLTLRTPLHFDHPAGTPAQPVTLSGSGVVKTLTAPAAQFGDTLALNNRAGLAVGNVLRLGAATAYEYGVIAAIAGNPADPGDVTLTTGLRRSLPAGGAAERVAVGAPGVGPSLLDDVMAGDGVARLAGPLTAAHVQISDADPARREYHTLDALSDAAGYYRLDGLGRLAAITLHAADGALTADQEWVINYRRPINEVNFRLE
jgi:hypothetical protein